MGPSGSGKTTLLDVLAGRKTTGRIDGSVLFEGVKPSRTFLRRYTGYVEQFGADINPSVLSAQPPCMSPLVVSQAAPYFACHGH